VIDAFGFNQTKPKVAKVIVVGCRDRQLQLVHPARASLSAQKIRDTVLPTWLAHKPRIRQISSSGRNFLTSFRSKV
jgi:hypothetical protein